MTDDATTHACAYTKVKKPAFFKCGGCRRSFGTRDWCWWIPWDDDRICSGKCPFGGGHGYVESEMVAAAFSYGEFHHRHQQRAHGTPYWSHPVAVVAILQHESPAELSQDLTAAAYPHDVLEDSHATREEISERFGADILEMVEILTKGGNQSKREYFDRIRTGPDGCRLIKVADRVHNLREMHMTGNRERVARYLRETREEVLAIAHALSEYAARTWAEATLRKELQRLDQWLAAFTRKPSPRFS